MAQQRPDVVLVAESGFWYLVPLEVGDRVIPTGTAAWDEVWSLKRQALVDELAGAGAARMVFMTVPCFPPDWTQRFPRLAPGLTTHANEILAAIAARNAERVSLIDLAGYLCPDGHYQPGLGSVELVRVDGMHYSEAGADLVGRWLAPQVERIARRAPAQ